MKPEVKRPRRNELQRIDDVLHIDQQIVNFKCVIPGKVIGYNIIVTNKSSYE